MNDAEFAETLRGWKPPPELGEEVGPDRQGINPFTKQPVTILGGRSPVAPEPVADPDAVRTPNLDRLQRLAIGDLSGEDLDALTRILFDWPERYAVGEVSRRWVVGPEMAGEWFQLVPSRVVEAIAELRDDNMQSMAGQWARATSEPAPDLVAILPRIREFCRDARAARRSVYLSGTR